MREGFETWIQELTKFLKESQAQESHERHLRGEIERASPNPHANLKKVLEELRNLKDYNLRLKEDDEILRNKVR